MLVLSRNPNQKIIITVPGYSPITVTVVQIQPGKVRLGIDADRSVEINREELEIAKNSSTKEKV